MAEYRDEKETLRRRVSELERRLSAAEADDALPERLEAAESRAELAEAEYAKLEAELGKANAQLEKGAARRAHRASARRRPLADFDSSGWARRLRVGAALCVALALAVVSLAGSRGLVPLLVVALGLLAGASLMELLADKTPPAKRTEPAAKRRPSKQERRKQRARVQTESKRRDVSVQATRRRSKRRRGR